MKKRSLIIGLMLMCTLTAGACGKENTKPVSANTEAVSTAATEAGTETTEKEVITGEVISESEIPEGMVLSDLTGEFISKEIENQRPIAVMVDNESKALPHYGLTEADIVYEMVNSTANGRITRLMALVKDWESLGQFGSIRSARATNCMLTMEWNAILCHDGGPFYINNYTSLPSCDHLSGFSRIPNGKAYEYTEYITSGEVAKRLKAENIEAEYNKHYAGTHFTFTNNIELSDGDSATYIAPPFPHNSSELEYDEETQLYYYSEYGKAHVDPANDNAQLSFKNVILQEANMYTHKVDGVNLDQNGYMYYQLENSSGKGYYAVNGKVIPITWKKGSLTSPTQYFDEAGNELILNVGKTYIGIVPADSWSEVVIK